MSNRLKTKILKLKESSTLVINEKSKELINQGKKVYQFGFGQSPFPVPAKIVEALKNNAHRKEYLPIQGLSKLREAISGYLQKKTRNNYPKENILITPGSKEAMLLMHIAFNGEIIIPAPGWVSYEPQAQIGSNKVHWLETSKNNNWFPTAEDLEKKIKRIGKKKNLILILNSPNNPSGAVCDKLEELAKVAKKYKLIVLSDEIYTDLTFENNYKSISKYYPELTFITGGLSKWCGAGGWRLGYFIIPKNLKSIKDSLNILASETFSAVSAPIQYAAIKAYEGNHKKYIKSSKEILKAVGNYVYENLNSNNVLINKPQGGFYLMPEFISTKFESSSEMCKNILETTGVALLPGSDFGFDKKKMLVRLSFTDFNGENFMKEYEKNNLEDNDLIEKLAPKVVEGVNRLKKWSEAI